jgi:hypothetical protein
MSRIGKTVPINWIGDTEKYIVVPRVERNRVVKKLKSLIKVKGGCYFTQGVPYGLIDFIYRAVVKLSLKEHKLIFSRGSVKNGSRPTLNMVEVCELDWDLGTSIIIPQKRKYGSHAGFCINGRKSTLRIMEIIVLSGLLRLTHRNKSEKWRSAKAAAIIALGWQALDDADLPEIKRSD